jgi:uncharacterized protein DUF2795
MVRKEEKDSETIEHGDLFFFYRPKIESREVQAIEDVQRFYMVTSPEWDGRVTDSPDKRELHRLFLLGQKRLPEIIEGKSTSKERNWALNVLTTSNPEDMRRELLPYEYSTETRGKRKIEAAAPAGEGKYSIVKHDNHTELAYILELPESPGPTQREFEIKKEASYIVSVKNPDIQVPGFAAFSAPEKKPKYPTHLKEMFGDRRWINVEDPSLLNYENTQLLLIGARKKDVEEELGVDIDEEKESKLSSDLFKELQIRREQVPLKPIFKGDFPREEEIPIPDEVKKLGRDEYPGRKGGKIGGKAAATKAASAASIARLLSGIRFPKKKEEVVAYARKNKGKIDKSEEEKVIETINELADRTYHTIIEVEKALGEVR